MEFEVIIEYAVEKETKQIMHIDDVPNGAKCNCICKSCNDELIARNGGKLKKHHFAHRNLIENRACRMTQLHLAMQHYFLSLDVLTIPQTTFAYKNHTLKTPLIKTKILAATLEHRIGNYVSDVCLNTDTGLYIVEICVTHKCEPEKVRYFKNNKINSVELVFEYSEDIEIEEWYQRIKNNQVPNEWFYYSECIKAIECHELAVEKEINERRSRRLKNTLNSIDKTMKNKTIFLPSIHESITYEESNEVFTESFCLYPKKNRSVDKLSVVQKNDNYFILRGDTLHKGKEFHIWIIYLLNEFDLNLMDDFDGSVIIRFYPIDSNNPQWRWLKYPSLEKEKTRVRSQFIKICKENIHIKSLTIYMSNRLKNRSYEYLNMTDELFNRDYSTWNKWLISHKLFTPNIQRKWPKLPIMLKEMKESPSLWMFQRWSILVISIMINIIDNISTGSSITVYNIFNEMSDILPLDPEFISLEAEAIANKKTIQLPHRHLIFRRNIILEVLQPLIERSILTVKGDIVIKETPLQQLFLQSIV